MQKENINQLANSIKRNIQFKLDYLRIINILIKYPNPFANCLEFYIHSNKILYSEIVDYLPTVELVSSEISYVEGLSKKYKIDINEFTLGSTQAFFTAVASREKINEQTFMDKDWCYIFSKNRTSFSGTKLNIYEPYPFSKKEYAKSVDQRILDEDFKKVDKKRNTLIFKENILLKSKQKNDQTRRMINMGEKVSSPKDIRYLDLNTLVNEKMLLKAQEARILSDYKFNDIKSKIEVIIEEIKQMQLIREEQIDKYHQLKAYGYFEALWWMKVELEKYDVESKDKNLVLKHK